MLATAWRTPLPPYLPASPSRSSTASWLPVLAPLGTSARPTAPPLSSTSTSMVGLPRESSPSSAVSSSIRVMGPSPPASADGRAARIIRFAPRTAADGRDPRVFDPATDLEQSARRDGTNPGTSWPDDRWRRHRQGSARAATAPMAAPGIAAGARRSRPLVLLPRQRGGGVRPSRRRRAAAVARGRVQRGHPGGRRRGGRLHPVEGGVPDHPSRPVAPRHPP